MTFNQKLAELKQQHPNLVMLGEVYCSICGNFEIYYTEQETGILLRTCKTCSYIKVIDLNACPSLY